MRGLPARSGNGPALPPAAATDRLALSNNARLPSRAKEPLPVDSLVPLRSAVAGPAHFLPLERLVTAVCGAPEAQVGHIMLSACAASAESPGWHRRGDAAMQGAGGSGSLPARHLARARLDPVERLGHQRR